jgi:hypothetical protein
VQGNVFLKRKHMSRIALVILVAGLGLAGCASTPDAHLSAASDEMPTGYAGITTAMLALEIGKAVEQGSLARARNGIDLQLAQSLDWMSSASEAVASEESFKKGRSKLIALIKTRWLAQPPHFLGADTEAYLDSTCKVTPACPSGDIKQGTSGEEHLKKFDAER